MWIKICGITSLEDAELAIAAGADAVGFVFAESPRRVIPKAARDIIEKLPPSIEKIGVFVDATLDEIVETHRFARLTGVQLHGPHHAVRPLDVRSRSRKNPGPLRVLQVVRFSGDNDRFALELRRLHEHSAVDNGPAAILDAVLIDTCVAGKQGGTGQAFDWLAARESFLREAPHLRLIAAGGLRPENVREAIQMLEPWGVDVSSGVEASPGRKDPKRVADFVRIAREAWAELSKAVRV